jgi:hypothetical protein
VFQSVHDLSNRSNTNSEIGRTAFCVSRRTGGLPHLGRFLTGLPTFQSLPPHSYSRGRNRSAFRPFSSHSHTPCGDHSNISKLHVLPNCSRTIQALAITHPHPGHYSRYPTTCTVDRLNIPLWMPADRHHRPGTSVRVTTLSFPVQNVWNSAFPDNRPPYSSQGSSGTVPPNAEDSHHVLRRTTVEPTSSHAQGY